MASIAKIGLQHVSSLPIECTISAGSFTVLIGKSDSCVKTVFHALASRKKPAAIEKSVEVESSLNLARWSTKTTLQSVMAKRSKAECRIPGESATDIIAALGLWEQRKVPMTRLAASYEAELCVLEALFAEPDLLVLDHEFDRLDLHTLQEIMRVCKANDFWQMAVVAVSQSASVASHARQIIGFCGQECSFAGSPEELVSQTRSDDYEVGSNRFEAIQQMVAPLEIEVESIGESIHRFSAPAGQGVAMKLLVEGYGDVKFVTRRRPTLEGAIANLLARRSNQAGSPREPEA